MLSESNAATRIQSAYRKHRRLHPLRTLQSRMDSTHSRLQSLIQYTTSLSRVHPSKITSWILDRKIRACVTIQRSFRRYRDLKSGERSIVETDTQPEEVSKVKKVDDKDLNDVAEFEDLILSRIESVSIADYAQLDSLLTDHYSHEPIIQKALGESESETIDKILENWEEMDVNVGQINGSMRAEHELEIEWADRKWWDRIPEEGSDDEGTWLKRVEAGIY